MALALDLGDIESDAIRRALERISTQWPQPTAVVTTATRPSAARVAVGTVIYDTTLHRPVWSDGTTWRGADGLTA